MGDRFMDDLNYASDLLMALEFRGLTPIGCLVKMLEDVKNEKEKAEENRRSMNQLNSLLRSGNGGNVGIKSENGEKS